MCLYKGKNEMQTASEDIVCYKVVEIVNGKIRSYYQQTPIKLNVPIEASRKENKFVMDACRTLTVEVVHSYKDKDLSESDMRHFILLSKGYHVLRLMDGYKISVAVLKCVIPKGTLYCSNILRTRSSIPEYGSVVLIPKEIIAEYEL